MFEFFSEVPEMPENVEVLDRPTEVSEHAFEYSDEYIDENGFYVPRQINGVYEDSLESDEVSEIVDALKVWHMQEGDCSCAVVCSEMELNRQLDADITEAELCKEGEENGWFNPEAGTPPDKIGEYAEAHGLQTQTYFESVSLEDIKDLKEDGTGVVVAVDNMLLARPDLPGPCVINHVVEIVGFDYSDAEHPLVIINDPGTPHGQGAAYDLDVFANAAGGYSADSALDCVLTLNK